LNFADLFTQTSNIETFVQKKEKEDAENLKQELERKEKEKKEKLLLQRASSVVKPAEPTSVTIYESVRFNFDKS
jgi:riboflavin synthase